MVPPRLGLAKTYFPENSRGTIYRHWGIGLWRSLGFVSKRLPFNRAGRSGCYWLCQCLLGLRVTGAPNTLAEPVPPLLKDVLRRSLVWILLLLVVPLSGLHAQVFDERFDDWPTDLKINGTVVIGRSLVDGVQLKAFLPRGTTLDQIRIVVDDDATDEQIASLRASLGQEPAAKTDEAADETPDPKEADKNQAGKKDPDTKEDGADEAKPEEIIIEVLRESKELATQLDAALEKTKVLVWHSQRPSNTARVGQIAAEAGAIRSFVDAGGTFMAVGEFASMWGRHFRDAEEKIHDGFDLIPSTALSFATKTDKLSRAATLGIIASRPRTVGVEVDTDSYLILSDRKVRIIGVGKATFVLMGTDHLPQRVESISQPTSRRQSPLEVIVDLTEWRRDAIDRTIDRFPPLNPKTPFVEKGSLVIVGGGGMPKGLMEEFVELAGAANARLVYIPCTEADEVSTEQSIVKLWERMGVAHATFIHTKDRHRANSDDEFLEPLREATGIWFGGGRQWNLADSYYGTTAHKLMKDVVLRGGVIGGSSAGASIQGRYLARATPIQNFRIMAPGYERGGLGFLSGVAIDQHFSQRGRQKDMTQLVNRYPQLLGIGLDEATAIVVKGGVADVVGRGKAHFYDRNQPVYPGHPDYIALSAGSKYDLGERKILKNADETQNGRIASPVVHDDGRVTFRLKAPEAKQVLVKGLSGQKDLPLTRSQLGVWEGTTAKLPPELYSYTFDVDGATQLDPSNRDVKKWLACASLVEVRGETPRIYEQTDVPHGTVHQHIYPSTTTGEQRRVFVYTPPQYSPDGDQSYPMLVLMHGFGDDASAWTEVGRANFIADNLVAQGKIRPAIIVMPYGHPIPIDEKEKFDNYAAKNISATEDDLKNDLLPFLKERYRLATDRKDMAIVGLSMGGGQSLTIGLRNLDLFSAIGGFSSSAPQGEAETIAEQLGGIDKETAEKQLRLLWVACGEEDFRLERNEKFIKFLEERGIPHTYHSSSGGHDWIVWREYLAEFLALTFATE